MANAKEATENAREYLNSFFPDAENVQLEEVELADNKSHWEVIFSFEVAPTTPSEMLSVKKTTLYKLFSVEKKSGEVVSMKIPKMK